MHSQHPQFTPPSPEIESRIDTILEQLTIEEKIDLLGGQRAPKEGGDTYGHDGVGIPPLKFADASVGLHWWTDRSTTYPSTIALAATWDRDLAYRAGAALGRDARARGIHVVLGPGVNLYRSALCGRNFEYLGEDPCLAAESVTGFIRGLQDQGVAATVKHFAVNYQEFDRHNVSSDVDERTLRELYLPAFRAAIETAGSGALMTAYNLVNSVHASEHDWLIRHVLKGEWNFQGLVMSDWVSTYSAVNAANAGLDLEMPTAKWMTRDHLLPAVRNGLVTEAVVDDKIRRLLRLMLCFGWIDHPQQDTGIPLEDPASAAVALEIAHRGCVLLKNDQAMLPLNTDTLKRIAVIGPCARQTPIGGGGSAYNKPWRSISILDGLRTVFGADCVRHCAGVLPDNSAAAFANARYRTPTGEPGLRADYFSTPDRKGEPVASRIEPRLEQRWGKAPMVEGMPSVGGSVRWTGIIRPEQSGTHLFYQWFAAPFRVLLEGSVIFDMLDGATLIPPRVVRHLEAGRDYPIEVLYRCAGEVNGACLGWEFCDVQALRDTAVDLARTSDAVIFCGGHSQQTEGEGFDRPFAIQAEQEELLLALADVNPDITAVITAGGNVDMQRWIDRVRALLIAWYPGQEGGTAVAEILSGAVNPSGRLPATFERCLEDRSSHDCYHDADGDRRVLLSDGLFTGYRHHDRTGVAPLFPFGFGLSYTSFTYADMACPATFPVGGNLTVSLAVSNTGERAGIETVQLYLRDCQASVPRPFKELKGFASVAIEPGTSQTVNFTLTEKELQFFCPHRRVWMAEPGEFEVMIGASAADIHLTARFAYG